MKCPRCGAHNPDHASWCGQCMSVFPDAASAEGSAPGPVDKVASATSQLETGTQSDALRKTRGDPPRSAQAGGFALERTEGGLIWKCALCDERNSMELDRCGVCGTHFAASFDAASAEQDRAGSPKVVRSAQMARALSLLPGAAHLYLGSVALSIGMGTLFFLVVISVFAIPSRGPILTMLRLLFALTGAGLIATSIIDAGRILEGDRPFFSPRAFLVLTISLLFILIIGLTAGVMTRVR